MDEPKRIELDLSPEQVAASLAHLDDLVFFDSSGNLPNKSKSPISIISADPKNIITGKIQSFRDRELLRNCIIQKRSFTTKYPFPCGGAFGWIDYEGDFAFGIYHDCLIYDHTEQSWWELGQIADKISPNKFNDKTPVLSDFTASVTQSEYEAGVRKVKDYIAAGDIYQVNLTQRFRANCSGGSLFPLYQFLRAASPAPHSVWLCLGDKEILSSSPETFLDIHESTITTRPIKGTRPRHSNPNLDHASASELVASEKEMAELIMITDLERNDLGQVCKFGSVKVTEMLSLEKLQQVYHLVSTVQGTLDEKNDHISALAACFPGGSITGAPKKRAMEIIKELEPVPRGLYTGAVGYFGFNDISQFNIAIRTLVREGENLDYHVGAGIVSDSDPTAEYEETIHKARGIREALSQLNR